MPELPEVAALVEALDRRLAGHQVAGVRLASITVAKTADPPLDRLTGHTLTGAGRRGKWILLGVDDGSSVAVHLMHGGRLGLYAEPQKGRPKNLLGSIVLDDGHELRLREFGTHRRAGIWWVRDATEATGDLGPDALDPELDADSLLETLAEPPAQLHTALRDQRRIAGIGRAYADEICWAAQMSPFTATKALDARAAEHLRAATVTVLTAALDRERAALAGKADAPAMAQRHDRSALAVHDKAGQPCPRCGTTVLAVHFADHHVGYCPTCQTGGRKLKDRRLSRLGIVE
jgi:formamidopyrimidine-DNA glycosylase